MTRINATPLVRKLASAHAVDLAGVTGTGAGGRITTADVRRAAGVTPKSGAAAIRRRPSLVITQASRWSRHTSSGSGFLVERREVSVDVYGPNPLVDEVRQANPEPYAEAVQRGTAPTLFTTGDLPLFTAFGGDPALLEQLPWIARHAAAQATAARATEIFETFGTPSEQTWAAAQRQFPADPGVLAYQRRVDDWLRGAER